MESLTSSGQATHVEDTSGRAYRSRKARPCDRCRRSKHRCDIGAEGPPCVHCTLSQKECTFDLRPPPRPSRAPTHQTSSPPSPPWRANGSQPPSESLAGPAKRPRIEQPADHWAIPNSSPAPGLPGRGPYMFRSDATSTDDITQLYDPFVVTALTTDDLLPVTSPNDETREYARQISTDPSHPVVMVMKPRAAHRHTFTEKGAQILDQVQILLSTHPSTIHEHDLLSLYSSNIHTAMPMLPDGPMADLSSELRVAILASALIASEPGRPLAPLVANMLEEALPYRTEENLSGIATSLFMVGLRPQYSSRSSSLLLSRTITLAQILGLHIDPFSLSISPKEQELRCRLWWCLVIQDSWMSLLKSRPSHIQKGNFSVPIPSLSFVLVASCAYATASSDSAKSFIAMCQLALLARRLQAETSTLEATKRSPETRAGLIQGIWDEVEVLGLGWQEQIASTTGRANGVANFLLLFLGFRCLLKRLLVEAQYKGDGPVDIPDSIASPFHDFVALAERLNKDELRGYFLMNTQQMITLVVASVIRLSLPDTSPVSAKTLPLLTRLVRQLNTMHGTCVADLVTHGLSRAINTSLRFRSTGEYPLLCQAIDDALVSADPPFNFDLSTLAQLNTQGDMAAFWDWTTVDWTGVT